MSIYEVGTLVSNQVVKLTQTEESATLSAHYKGTAPMEFTVSTAEGDYIGKLYKCEPAIYRGDTTEETMHIGWDKEGKLIGSCYNMEDILEVLIKIHLGS